MTHLTYLEAAVVGLVQGVSELFPVSSLGHNVLIPALVGGSWASDLNVAAPESPYLAFIVGPARGHRDRAARLLLAGLGPDHRRVLHLRMPGPRRCDTADQKLAWMIILATIPVGLVGLAFEHAFRVLFGKPISPRIFLAVNGLILLAGERYRPARSAAADAGAAADRERGPAELAGGGPGTPRARRPSRQREQAEMVPGRPAAVRARLPAGRPHRLGADPGAAGRASAGTG